MSGYCGRCSKHYTRKSNWLAHFELTRVRTGTGFGYSANVCYKYTGIRIFERTLELAKARYADSLKAPSTFKRLVTGTDNSTDASTSKLRKIDEETVTGAVNLEDPHDKLAGDEDEGKHEDESKDNEKDDESDDNEKDEDESNENETDVMNIPITGKHIPEPTDVSTTNIDKLFDLLTSIQKTQENNHTELKEKIDAKCNCLNKPACNSSISTSFHSSEKTKLDKNIAIEADEKFVESMLSLKHASSMKAIMSNDLIKGNFSFREVTKDGNIQHELYCVGCSDKSLRGLQGDKMRTSSFSVKDPDYCHNKDIPMLKWFSNLKLALRRHCEHISHHQYTTSYNLLQTRKFQNANSIRRMQLNILYYIIKTNSPFTLYPILLAVLSRCGMEIGNKNYSRYNVPKILDLLGDLIKESVKQWMRSEENITITCDIATVSGLVMLTALLVSDKTGETKLAGFKLVTSKDGKTCANEVMNILTDNLGADLDDLKIKVTGVAGDGAFIKGNMPFKSRLKELLHPNLKFRWDILHLVNCAFEHARDQAGNGVPHSTLQLMSFVQGQSKEWRSGLDYTAMRINTLKEFKRPKTWSETRMVNYEYEQLLRFRECSAWWDLPNWVELLSMLYLPATYLLKIILSKAQSTDVQTVWVERVFGGDTPDGCNVMKKSVHVAVALIQKNNYNDIIDEMPDIVRTVPSSTKVNILQRDFKKWVKKYSHLFTIDRLGDAITRSEATVSIDNLDPMVSHLHQYIDLLFVEIQDRLYNHTDLDGDTCWSEAPAESIFSVFKMCLSGRQSLTLSHTESLCRLITNGPPAATEEAEQLIDKAAKRKGIEFTTQNWQIRFIPKLICQIKKGEKKKTVVFSDSDSSSEDEDC